jgi:aspartate carbamoyltransferase catalytic subunit
MRKGASSLFHLVEAQQFTKKELRELFDLSDRMEKLAPLKREGCLRGKVLCSLFFIPSLRTRFSFEAGMLRLGGDILSTETAEAFSSELKGRFEDTIRVASDLSDVIILRHYASGSARRAATVSRVPVINAGDGAAQHPTQALIDLYTIDHHQGGVDGCSIAMVGDLTSRSVRTLCYFLAKFHGVHIYFISPDVTKAKDDIKEYLQRHKVWFSEITDSGVGLAEVAEKADVVYMTQLTKEHFADRYDEYERAFGNYLLNTDVLNRMKKTALIMHPLPRGSELPVEVDQDHRAVYVHQTRYGLHLRMAILCTVMNTYPEP